MDSVIEYGSLAIYAAVASLLVRGCIIFIYRKWFRQGIVWDSALHYAVIHTLKQNGRYSGVPAFLMQEEPDSYPIAFHRLASLLPLDWIKRYQYLPSLGIFAVSFAGFVMYVHYIEKNLLLTQEHNLVVWAAAFYLVSVSNLVFNANAILYISLSERLLAQLSCSWFFLLLAVGVGFGDKLSLALAVFVGALVGISSIFGRQTVTFTTPLVALFLFDGTPLLVLAAAFVGALLLDRGYFLRGLRHMVTLAQAYNRHTKRSAFIQPALSRFVNWRRVFGRGIALQARLNELATGEPTRLLLQHPNIILFVSVFLIWPVLAAPPLFAIVLATLAVYLLTSTKLFNHFGEAARYIEFNLALGVPFFLALYAVKIVSPELNHLLIPAYFCSVGLLTLWFYYQWQCFPCPKHDELATFLAPLGLRDKDTVFPIPFTLGGSIWMRAPACRVLMYQGAAVTPSLYEKFVEDVPLLKKNWWPLFEEYGVTYVIGLTVITKQLRNIVGWDYDYTQLRKVAESDYYVAYAVPAVAQPAPIAVDEVSAP